MEQMSAAIREVARNANDTLLQTRQSSDEATHGAQRVARTITAIRTLADEIGNASGRSRADHNANRINEVVNVINAISQQTNLLALNAAIEAPGLVNRDAALRWWPTRCAPSPAAPNRPP
jgi:methyl-accepting chemotaxis protein